MSEILEEHKLYLSHRQLLEVSNAFLKSSVLLQIRYLSSETNISERVPNLSWSDGLLDVRDDPVHHVLLLHPPHNIGSLQLVVQTLLNLEKRNTIIEKSAERDDHLI